MTMAAAAALAVVLQKEQQGRRSFLSWTMIILRLRMKRKNAGFGAPRLFIQVVRGSTISTQMNNHLRLAYLWYQ
jgi:hypothetical protein